MAQGASLQPEAHGGSTEKIEQAGVSRRFSKAPSAFSIDFVFKVVRKRGPTFAATFAILFTVIAIAQYLFVRHSVYKSSEAQLHQWASEAAAEIGYKDRWNLTAHRQSEEIETPHLFVFTSNGIIVETTGFIPGLFGKVKLVDESILGAPKTLKVPDTGEIWREFAVNGSVPSNDTIHFLKW